FVVVRPPVDRRHEPASDVRRRPDVARDERGARLVRVPERVPTEVPEEESAREDPDEGDVPQETQPHPVSRGGAAGPHEVAMPDSVRGPFATRTPRLGSRAPCG